ncbi:unnamed protein product [uncultured virus]|nr:unnamed protein product [uncultured virus]
MTDSASVRAAASRTPFAGRDVRTERENVSENGASLKQ